MKQRMIFIALLSLLFACSKDPSACECGKNLMKPLGEQDATLKDACEQKVQSLPENKQMDWYNKSMECMNEQ